jgi:hypothetical protein
MDAVISPVTVTEEPAGSTEDDLVADVTASDARATDGFVAVAETCAAAEPGGMRQAHERQASLKRPKPRPGSHDNEHREDGVGRTVSGGDTMTACEPSSA